MLIYDFYGEIKNDNPSCISPIQLIKVKKRDLKKCIICQQTKKHGETKLTSTPDDIQKILDASKILKGSLVANLSANELQSIRYHVKNCYGSYILKSTRISERSLLQGPSESEDENAALESTFTSPPPPTTRQSSGASRTKSVDPRKLCIICNVSKRKGTKKLHRICEGLRAEYFLAAIEFNKDEVYQRCIMEIVYINTCYHLIEK